ncbi:hypothetical protein ACGFIY_21530 [Micromonospora chersina]|uniref:hypothetical protein n=1 Tax=Micromonospora chersina TaxID=47854 RepID=UPI003711414E
MNPKNLRLAVTVAAVAIAVTGCGGNPTPTAAPSGQASTSAAPTPVATSAAPAASPSAITEPDTTHKYGKVVSVRDGVATATVYAYRQPVAKSAPKPDDQPGYVWGAADVKVCAGKSQGIIITNGPWTLVYADDTQIEASSIGYNQFPEPSYPFGEKAIAPGRCLRGWITFPVPGKKRPVAVEYAPEDEPAPPRWAVK